VARVTRKGTKRLMLEGAGRDYDWVNK
jgi:hypothetical protein